VDIDKLVPDMTATSSGFITRRSAWWMDTPAFDKTRNRTKEALRTEEARSSKEALTRDPKHNNIEDTNP
jgi:hypothetical protein